MQLWKKVIATVALAACCLNVVNPMTVMAELAATQGCQDGKHIMKYQFVETINIVIIGQHECEVTDLSTGESDVRICYINEVTDLYKITCACGDMDTGKT